MAATVALTDTGPPASLPVPRQANQALLAPRSRARLYEINTH